MSRFHFEVSVGDRVVSGTLGAMSVGVENARGCEAESELAR